ncbi:Non-structural maintenance of chromosome element 4 [Sphaceloma murrayae]|uniref:Non-structural maintenance of chromosomes element 4 n=1 Tax=Sphaceloma murrayae TaxID=2082308 RepID=A0A2K1QJB3_9PEZI|nr:Non-structural maintenance of chromosome element 4 [Sphaceloma murrayae]
MPTPESAGSNYSQTSKRRRTSDDAHTSLIVDDLEEEDESDEEEPDTPSAGGEDDLEDVTDTLHNSTDITEPPPTDPSPRRRRKKVRFDPDQDPQIRRDLKYKSRLLEREFLDNRDLYIQNDNEGLATTVERANELFRGVKQTADATTDSRLLVNVSETTHKKSARLALGDGGTGIDVDEFVSKVISYMRQGARNTQSNGATSSQRRRQREEEEEESEYLDWAYLGARACFPFNSRPAVPGFLLGPLSVQKRVRAPIQRRARQRNDDRVETRPEALERQDMPSNDTSTVRHACAKIKSRLRQHCAESKRRAESEAREDMTEDEVRQLLRKHRMADTEGPSLFDFVVNPRSFGQTVENLFYVSFLIKEGEVGVEMDSDGLPSLVINTESATAATARESTKHQAVFAIDMPTWKSLIKAYDIKESLIAHREEGDAHQVGATGWYG